MGALDTIRPTFGFDAGDEVMSEAAERVAEIARSFGGIAAHPTGEVVTRSSPWVRADHRRNWRRCTLRLVHPPVVLAAVVIAAALTACGSGDDVGDSTPVETTATPTGSTGDPTDALSGDVICERLSVASVTADVGLDIVRATPDDSATPQCAYEYTTETGGVSNLTVASMRAEDVDGLTGRDAFDFVVGINESIAGDGAETQEVSAGDAAIRISGASLHIGVVQVGDRVLTVVIPVDDVEADAADSLIATMATTLG